MLPKIEAPLFETKLPLTGLKITFRPILVKEEKTILIATQSDDPDQMRLCVRQILTNCIQNKDFDPDKYPLADIEYLIIQIRDKSLGGSIDQEYTCNADIAGDVCGTKFKVKIEFNKLEIVRGTAKDKVQITDKIGLKLKPLTFGILTKAASSKNDEPFDYAILTDAIDFVFEGDNTYKLSESSKEEIEEFFDSMKKEHIDAVSEYIQSMPHYEIAVKHKCTKCGTQHDFKVNDLANFFQ